MFIFLFLWSYIAYGMTTIIVYGSIFEKPRDWFNKNIPFIGKLMSCPLCTSTWVGFFLSIFLSPLTHSLFGVPILLGIFFDGMFTAGTVWSINSIVEYFEENTYSGNQQQYEEITEEKNDE